MKVLQTIINFLIACFGIFIIGIGVGYLCWFYNYIITTNPEQTIINIALVTCGFITPGVAILGIGMLLFIKILMDPFEFKTNS